VTRTKTILGLQRKPPVRLGAVKPIHASLCTPKAHCDSAWAQQHGPQPHPCCARPRTTLTREVGFGQPRGREEGAQARRQATFPGRVRREDEGVGVARLRPLRPGPKMDRARSTTAGSAGIDRPGLDRPRLDRPRLDRPRLDRQGAPPSRATAGSAKLGYSHRGGCGLGCLRTPRPLARHAATGLSGKASCSRARHSSVT
jgi:hypothetical protein